MITKHLSELELERLYNFLETSKTPQSTLIWLLSQTGMRADELAKVTFSDINIERKSVIIKASKGSNNREIELPDALISELAPSVLTSPKVSVMSLMGGIYNEAHVNERVRHNSKQYLRVHWRSISRSLGINMGLHCLRHTVGVRTLAATGNAYLTQVILGHKDIRNTMRYAAHEISREASLQLLNAMKLKKVG